jgi:ABC-type dipeptide/oligopeptide/nickel transport system permease subunit
LDIPPFLSKRLAYLSVITETASGKVGLLLTAALLSLAIFAPLLTPYPPNGIVGHPYAPPSTRFILGTDDIGEDILSQLILATRGSVLVAIMAGTISTTLGVAVGLIAGYYGGRFGEILMRFTDIMLVLPLLPLLIVIGAYVPPSIYLIVFIIGIFSWPITARSIFSQTLTLKARPMVDICRLSGMSDMEIMFKVLLPNQISLAVAYGVFAAVSAVVIESGLDFIGLGSVQNLSWGIMLYFALSRNALLRGAWQWFLPPGIMIALLGSGLILIGYAVERAAKVRE